MSRNREEGGERALLGFYYQMIVTMGVGALAASTREAATSRATPLFKIQQQFDKEYQIIPEADGQDAAMVSGSVVMLLQMKHSSNPNRYKFYPSDFREVLKSFIASYKSPSEHSPTHFVIITNRPGSEEFLRQLAFMQHGHADSDDAASSPGLEEVVNNWLSGSTNAKSTKKRMPRSDMAAAMYILPRLTYINAPMGRWRDEFRYFAESFGAKANEIIDAENELLGRMIARTGEAGLITKSDIIRAITGYAEAIALTPDQAGAICMRNWKRRVSDHGTQEEWMIPRKIPGLSEVLLTNKVTFLIGQGGCGKSSLMAQITRAPIDLMCKSHGNDFDGFVAAGSCRDETGKWLEATVGEWGKRGSAGSWFVNDPLQRLTTANPNRKRLLWIALDALDEANHYQVDLRPLINMAREREDLAVIFTCRAGEDCENILQELFGTETGKRPDDTYIGQIDVPDFTDDEVVTVLQQAMGEEVSERVAMSLNGVSASGRQAFPFADPRLIESLHHPRLLGSFIQASERNHEFAMAALDGESPVLDKIADEFVSVFLRKYEARRRFHRLYPKDAFKRFLKELAGRDGRPFTLRQWEDLASSSLGSPRESARWLLREAMTGGIIQQDGSGDRYFWRHDFVTEYLVRATV